MPKYVSRLEGIMHDIVFKNVFIKDVFIYLVFHLKPYLLIEILIYCMVFDIHILFFTEILSTSAMTGNARVANLNTKLAAIGTLYIKTERYFPSGKISVEYKKFLHGEMVIMMA